MPLPLAAAQGKELVLTTSSVIHGSFLRHQRTVSTVVPQPRRSRRWTLPSRSCENLQTLAK